MPFFSYLMQILRPSVLVFSSDQIFNFEAYISAFAPQSTNVGTQEYRPCGFHINH